MCFTYFMSILVFTLIYVIPSSILISSSDQCKTDSDCDTDFSICLNSKCVCPGGYVMNGERTKCLLGSEGYRKPCEDSVQCSYILNAGGQCINETCECAERYHYLKGRCLKTSGLGEKCSLSENCFVNYDFESTICNHNKICECAEGYYQREYSSCRRKAAHGEPCGINLDCQFENAVCTKERKCAFKNETSKVGILVLSPSMAEEEILTGLTSLEKKIGDNCQSDLDCQVIKYSFCNDAGHCSCQNGFYNNINKTICYGEVGSKCSSDDECVGKNMMCRKDKAWCTCKAGFVTSEDNKFCDKLSRDLNWSCLSDRWCAFFGPGGVCIDKTCRCSHDYHFVKEAFYCWVTKKVGEVCQTNLDCGSNTTSEICQDGKCMCEKGFHSSSDKLLCHKDSEFPGEPCNENLDCVYPHSFCNRTICSCMKGYISTKEKCLTGIGGHCNDQEKCSIEGSFCDNGTCICSSGKVANIELTKCLPEATKYNEKCEQSVQCTKLLDKGSGCINGSCICMKGYHYYKRGFPCFESKIVGQKCFRDGECFTANTTCQGGNCICIPPLKARNHTCSGVEKLTFSGVLVTLVGISIIINNVVFI